jgi:hypothetical protein
MDALISRAVSVASLIVLFAEGRLKKECNGLCKM